MTEPRLGRAVIGRSKTLGESGLDLVSLSDWPLCSSHTKREVMGQFLKLIDQKADIVQVLYI